MNINTQKAKREIREKIVSLFEIDKMSENKQEEMITRIGKIIFQSVLIRILPLLEEKDLSEYERLIESGAMPDVILDFFFEKVPDFLSIIREESEKLKNESATVLG